MLSKLRILIIDDSEDDAQLLLLELRHGPWEIRHERVETSDALRVALNAQEWDLVIADYSMPKFSGPAALIMVREHDLDMPFILVSGKVGEEAAVKAMKAGADDYLVKGDLGRLVPAVERELHDAEGRRHARNVEKQLRKRDAQLAEAQRLARLGTWHLDLRTNFAVWSDEACRIVGREPGDGPPTFDHFLNCLDLNDRAFFAFAKTGSDQSQIANDFRLSCPTCATKYVHIRGDVVHDANGVAIEVMGTVQDITERKVAEEELHRAQAELAAAKGLAESNRILQEQIVQRQVAEKALRQLNETLEQRVAERTAAAELASRAKSEFLANMSHEIRTPLTAIIGFGDLLLRPNQTDADRAECIHTVRRNSKHLLELINDILDLSKIEAGKMTVETIDCNVPQLIADILSTMKPRAAEKALEFHVNFAGPIPRVIQTDPLRFRQILVNLLGNAIKFTEKGSVALNVRFDQGAGSKQLRFEVVDSGIGMTTEQSKRLFQSFAQADESTTRRFGGTGLGLAISRRLAQLLGGDITVQSQIGVGSRFTVAIPCATEAGAEMISELTESELPTASDPLVASNLLLRGNILLAEDGRDNQRLLITHLKAAGAKVAVAENGQIAVDMATTQPFDLILMDMQMPVMDGYTATSELRRRGFTVPIIALTAHAMAEDRTKCLNSGCSDYLSKPVNQETLLRTICRHLGQAAPPPMAEEPATATPPAPRADGKIASTMSHYPGMKKIIVEFVDGLPEEIEKMQKMLQGQDLQALRRVVHQLRGTGGGYGFDDISDLAGNAEDSIAAADNLDSISTQINSLIDVIRRVEGFDESRAMAPITGDAQ